MKNTFKFKNGESITVETLHGHGFVKVTHAYGLPGYEVTTINFPAYLGGVIAQAIELCAEAVQNGPCSDQHAPLGRGMAEVVG